MATPTNNFKLGIFLLLGVAAALAIAITLGLLSSHNETVVYYTYFNESVTGLDLGAPVKFRGVIIGHVSGITIGPDHRHVEVQSEIVVKDIERMGLTSKGAGRHFFIPPDLRAQLDSQGITGVKFVSIDFFDPKSFPPPDLPFPTPPNYIPAAPSLIRNLEQSVTKVVERLPDLIDNLVIVVGRVDRILIEIDDGGVVGDVTATLASARGALGELRTAVAHVDRANLGERAAKTLGDAQTTVAKMNALLDKLDGNDGLLVSAKRATDTVADLGKDARGTTRQLEISLRDVGEAAEAIRELARSIDRDPDMLVKGRASTKAKAP